MKGKEVPVAFVAGAVGAAISQRNNQKQKSTMTDIPPPDTPTTNMEDKEKDNNKKGSPTGSSGSGNTDPAALISCGSLLEFENSGRRFVEELADKTYRGEDADDALDNDLSFFPDLHDQSKYIELSDEGKAHWTDTPPTVYHTRAVRTIDEAVKATNGDLFTDKEAPVFLVGTTTTKYPDLAVWGEGRLGEDGEPKDIDLEGARLWMNPHVVIEFSWSNKLWEEMDKISLQMTDHLVELGQVNMGILIKTIPTSGTDYPKQRKPAEIPLCGFDVYTLGSGESIDDTANPSLTYRCGVDGDEHKVISVDTATVDGGFQIRLSDIKDSLIAKCGVVFAMPEREGGDREESD